MPGNKKNKQRQLKPGSEVQPEDKPKKPASKVSTGQKAGWMKWMVFILPFVLYANTLGNQFSMDDELVTTKSNQVTTRGIAAIPQIFTSLYSENETQAYEYRPIVLTSFAIENQFFGVNPAASHFIQILLYAVLCLLILKTSRRIFPAYGMWFHFLITVLFIFHPLHTEVVASVKNRDEILAFIFALLSLNAFLTHAATQKWKYLTLGVLWFLIAWYSKLSAMPFAFIIPLAVYMSNTFPTDERGRISRKHVYQLLSYFGILVLAGFITQKMVYRLMFDPDMFVRHAQFFENPMYVLKPKMIGKLGMAGYTMAYYYKLLVVPNPLICYYGYNHVNYVGWNSWMSVAGFIGTAFLVIWSWIKIRSRQPWVFGILLMLASLSMFANLIRPAVGVIAERFAFEASLGFCIVLAWALVKLNKLEFPFMAWPSKNKFFAPVLIIILLLYSYKTFTRNGEWYDKKSVYSADLIKAPESVKINSLMATLYIGQLQNHISGTVLLPQDKIQTYTDSALLCFRQAVKVYPDYVSVNNNLGMFYFDFLHMTDSAKYHIGHALKLKPDYLQAHYNMGCMYEQLLVKSDEYLNFLRPFSEPVRERDLQDTKTLAKLDSILDPLISAMAQFKGTVRKTIRLFRAGGSPALRTPENLTAAIRQSLGQMHSQTGMPYNEQVQLPEQITTEVMSVTDADRAERREMMDEVVTAYVSPYVLQMAKNNIDTSQTTMRTQLARLYAYKNKQEREYRQLAYYHWKKVLDIDCRYQLAYEKLNEWYKRRDEMDSAAVLATEMLSCRNYKKADAYWRLAAANLALGDTLKAMDACEKTLKESDRMISRFILAINHFSAAGNVQTKQLIYNNLYRSVSFIYRMLQIMHTCYTDMNRTEDVKRIEERMIQMKRLLPTA